MNKVNNITAEMLPNFILSTDAEDEIVYETSYVEMPATSKGFLAFSASGKEVTPKVLHFAKDGQTAGAYEYVTSGVWMMPDTKYLRTTEDGQLYTVEFPKDSLKQMLLKHLKANMGNKVTLEHDKDWNGYLDGFVGVEHWIIEDANTKSPIYGLSLADMGYSADEIPVGTIMKSTFVGDKNFWYDYVVAGKVKGYSIGGLFGFEPKPEAFKAVVEVEQTLLRKSLFQRMGLDQTNGKILLNNEDELESFEKNNSLEFSDAIYINNSKGSVKVTEGEFTTVGGIKIVVKQGTLFQFSNINVAAADKVVEIATPIDMNVEPEEPETTQNTEVAESKTDENFKTDMPQPKVTETTTSAPVLTQAEIDALEKGTPEVVIVDDKDLQKQKDAELLGMINDLKKQMQSLEATLKVKDDQIATLQSQVQTQPIATAFKRAETKIVGKVDSVVKSSKGFHEITVGGQKITVQKLN